MKNNKIDMLNGPLLSKIILFALPLMITSTLQQLFNATDIAVVGRFAGNQALAAVGSNGPIINLIINLLIGLSMGANVVIANYIGQGRKDRVKDAVHTAVLISLRLPGRSLPPWIRQRMSSIWRLCICVFILPGCRCCPSTISALRF